MKKSICFIVVTAIVVIVAAVLFLGKSDPVDKADPTTIPTTGMESAATPESMNTLVPTTEPMQKVTPVETPEPAATLTPEPSPTVIVTPTIEPAAEPTEIPAVTVTPTMEPTAIPTVAPTATPTVAPIETPVPTPTNTPVPTVTPTVTPEPTPTAAPTSTPTPTNTPVPTSTPKPTSTPVPTATPKPTATPTPTMTPTPSPSPTPMAALNGSFHDIVITDTRAVEVRFMVKTDNDQVQIECSSSKENVVIASIEEGTKGNYFRLMLVPQGDGEAKVTVNLYSLSESGEKVIFDTKEMSVAVQWNTTPEKTWYSDYVADYPYKQHEWQYGSDILVSVWSQKESGYSHAIMIVDGTGEMWDINKGVEVYGLKGAVPWTDSDQCNYTQSIYEVHINEGITHVEQLGTSDLEVITFPSTLKSIGRDAFTNSKMAEIILPEGLEVIEEWAFSECYKVTKVELPSTLKYIGFGAFDLRAHAESRNKNLLLEVILPASLEYVGYRPFNYRWGINVIVPEGLDYTGFDPDWNTLDDI